MGNKLKVRQNLHLMVGRHRRFAFLSRRIAHTDKCYSQSSPIVIVVSSTARIPVLPPNKDKNGGRTVLAAPFAGFPLQVHWHMSVAS